MKLDTKKLLIILGIIILISLVFFGCTRLQKNSSTEDERRAEAEIIGLEEGKQIDDNSNIVGNAIQTYEKNLKYLGCSDSDGSKNYDIYGEVTLKYSYKGRQITRTFKDRCHKNQLLEYYCNKNNLALGAYKCPNGCENGACKKNLKKIVLIITNDYLINDLNYEITQYSDDLKKEFGFDTKVITISNVNLNWNFIDAEIYKYSSSNLTGVLFVGDIPSVLVNRNQLSDNFYYAKYYSSCTYDNQTNSYIIDEDCYFSSSIFPREKPFWIARITPDWVYEERYLSAIANCYDGTSKNITSSVCKTRAEFTENANLICAGFCSSQNPDKCGLRNIYAYDDCEQPEKKISPLEINKIKEYFKRNHLYRTGQLKNNGEILLYITDSMEPYNIEEDLNYLNFYSNLFKTEDLYLSDGSIEDNGNNFLEQLKRNYGFVMINAHGLPNYHEHNIYADRIPETNATFILLKSCNVGNYLERNAIAPTYLVKGALLVDSSSIPIWANSKLPLNLNYLLETGVTYNDASFIYPEYYSHIIFGDPTLKLNYKKSKVNGSKLNILENYKEIDLTKQEMQTTIKIENTGITNLKIQPYVTYTTSSQKIARIDTSFSEDDFTMLPGEQILVPFFIETDFGNSGESMARVRFITNDLSNPISEEINIRIIR
jgi:hypothetical protein